MNLQIPANQRPTIVLRKIATAARNARFWPWSAPLALLALISLSYGLRGLSLGLYWDDWPYLWLFHSLGPSGIVSGLAQDRPFLSFIYITTLSLFGSSTTAWQMFALLARWLCCVGMWWALAQAWPGSSHKVFWAAALFAVYPGFTQQWIAIIYGQAFLLYAAVLFSLGITLWLARRAHRPGARWRPGGPPFFGATLAALGLSAFAMFSTEYFFGIELLRPVLLWLALGQAPSARPAALRRAFAGQARRVLAWWAPYLALMIAFVVWRGFIHTFPGRGLAVVEGAKQSPVAAAAGLALTMAVDFIEATVLAWGQVLRPEVLTGWASPLNLRLPALVAVTGLLAWLYLARLRPAGGLPDSPAGGRRWAGQAAAVGLLAFFAAGWPFWITGLPMRMGFPQDRYTLPLAVGVCLLLAGLVDAAGRSASAKAAVLAAAIALAAGFHADTARVYRQDWHQMKDLMWQLTWRAPSIRPNTLLLTDSLGLRFYEDDSLTAPLNWTYDPENRESQMKYLLADLLVRRNSLAVLQPGVEVRREFRGKVFEGSTSQALVIAYDPPGCLVVLDPLYDRALPGLPERLVRALPLSSPQQWISPVGPAAVPPVEILGPEPPRRWCYYYQKASLARQQGDWQEVARLAGESIRQGIRPERPVDQRELLPFIEGYARVGRWDDAAELSLEAAGHAPHLQPALCSLWSRVTREQPDGGAQQRGLELVQERLNCETP